MVESRVGKQSAGDSPLPSDPAGARQLAGSVASMARVCLWITDEGDLTQWSLDAWASDWELETIYVRPLNPFDDPPGLGAIVAEALAVALERGVQLRLAL